MTGLANEIDLAVQLAPPRIADDAGVALAVHNLEFVGVDAQGIADWRARRAPLGMPPARYRSFCASFFAAAGVDNLPDADVRLKGSAAVVYSGRHKRFPPTRADYLNAFARAHGRPPTPSEEDDLWARFNRFWGHHSVPRRRPFDSMYELNLDTERSDYDVQISSDEIERRCSAIVGSVSGLTRPLRHPTYGFLDDALVALAVPAIATWANRWTATLGRTVAVKAFDGAGPANATGRIGELSSHFRTQDWMIRAPRPGID